jgi:methyl-accepting chemotaxis protein
MADQESAPIRTASRNLLVAAVVVLVGIGAATAFAIGFSGALEDSLANPSSAPAMRIAALERIRDVIGSDGFLKSYREGAEAPDIARRTTEADAALAKFRMAAEIERDDADARALAALLAPFHRAARDRMAGMPSPDPAALEQSYAALKLRVAEAIDSARFRRIETLNRAFAVAQTLAVLALSALSLTLFGLAWFLRTRLLEPLRTLRQSAEQAADGGMHRHVWGIERKDEIGAVARACNRLRRQLAALSEAPGSAAEAMRAVLENRPPTAILPPPEAAAGSGEVTTAARRLQSDLGTILSAVGDARTRIEDASRDAARASQTAIEAANLARAGAQRLTANAERAILNAGDEARTMLSALSSSVARLSKAAARLEGTQVARAGGEAPRAIAGRRRGHPGRRETDRADEPEFSPKEEKAESDLYAALVRLASTKEIPKPNSEAPFAGLAADLDTIEKLSRKSGGLGEGEAAALTAGLIEAIDRLNGVVEQVAAAAEKKPS